MEEALKLKEELLAAGLTAKVDGRTKTICLVDSARYSIGGFTGTVEEARALVAKCAADIQKAADFNAAQPHSYHINVSVNGTERPEPHEVRALVPGDEIKWAETDNGGSRQFLSGTIQKAGVTARAKFGRTTSGKPRTRWYLVTAAGPIKNYC